MIPFNFVYYRPDSLGAAAEVYEKLRREGVSAVYYAGGSEIITMCRAGAIEPRAVIDIKRIPECMILSPGDRRMTIGSACTLSQIGESRMFPLLALSCGRIADHTNQCRITLGGNLCGSIQYRETSLPLLLSDADISLYGPEGARDVPFHSVFDGRMRLKPGELVVAVHVPVWALTAQCAHMKKTANEKIDYPLVSVAAVWRDGCLRIAFSGVCAFPFRSQAIESVLNDRTMTRGERAQRAACLLPAPVTSDAEGSGEYRLFVFRNTIDEILEGWENGTL